jgi:PAS domain S-box-containing protein
VSGITSQGAPRGTVDDPGLGAAVITGVLVFLGAWVSLDLAGRVGGVVALWPTNAIAVAALAISPPRRWPAVVAFALAGNVLADLISGDTLRISLGLSLCNAFEITACAALTVRLIGPRPDLFDQRAFWLFAGISLGASLVTAGLASALLRVFDHRDALRTLIVWMLADVLGLLIVTPALLGMAHWRPDPLWSRLRAWRAVLAVTGLCLIDLLVFLDTEQPLLFLATAALIVFVFELERLGAALGLLITAVIAIGSFITGHGPMMKLPGDSVTRMLGLQVFLLVTSTLNMTVASTLAHRRQLRSALEDSELRYRRLAEQTTDIIIHYDAAGVIAFASPSVRQLGYAPDQMVGHNLIEFVHPEDRDLADRRRVDAVTGSPGDTALRRDVRVVRADGSLVWLEGNPSPVRDVDGVIIGAMSVLRDVSERRTAEDAVLASEAKYRLLAENATDVIATCTLDGLLTYVSPAAEKVFGYRPEELVGGSTFRVIHPDDVAHVTTTINAFIRRRTAGEVTRLEYRGVTKSGQIIWIEAHPSLLFDPTTGRVVGLQDLSRDVTARKLMEAALAHKTMEAEAAAVAKSEFLANISHELRTPLTGIIGFSGLLETVGDLPAQARKWVDKIALSSQLLLTLVNNILDFSRIDAGQLILDPQPVDPLALVGEAIEMVEERATAKGLAITTQVRGDLPPAVLIDGPRTLQVLLNLLDNAIKFTASGAVEVALSYGAGTLRLAVRDTGVGISQEHLARLFQRFSQVDGSISRQYGGTGLGLAICKGLAEAMGGEVGVESTPGEGATFWFTIQAPLVQQAERAVAQP